MICWVRQTMTEVTDAPFSTSFAPDHTVAIRNMELEEAAGEMARRMMNVSL